MCLILSYQNIANIDARLTIYYKNIDYSYTPGYTLAMCYFAP